MGGVQAQSVSVQPAPAQTVPDTQRWLSRLHTAASRQNYEGTMVLTVGGVASSSRVTHYCVGDQSFERVVTLDGRQQRVYRHNDAVHTLWPQAQTAVVERRDAALGLGAALQAVDPRAADIYALKDEGRDRVAGRDALVLLLAPPDAARYAQRLWVDAASGLMLRADVLAADHSVLESTAFSEVQIGIKPQPAVLQQQMAQLGGYRVLRPQLLRTALEAEGWKLAQPVFGFRLVAAVKRLPDASPAAAAVPQQAAPVLLQAVYSDGLTHVSLFIEDFDPARHSKPLRGQMGATSSIMQRQGAHWVTVVGDVPLATVRQFADALTPLTQSSPSPTPSPLPARPPAAPAGPAHTPR